MTLPFGIDISRHQYSADGRQKPNFTIINSRCKYVGIRATVSWGYTDPWFAYSWEQVELARLAYHVLYPGEDGERQMEHFLRVVNPGEHDRLVLDLELAHGYSKPFITNTVLECLNYLFVHTGRYPVIYSRASWVNDFLDVSKLPLLDWWLAHYLSRLPEPKFTPEKTPPPALPNGVTNWLIHQTGDRANGAENGVASYYVDTDRWNGTEEDVLEYFGLEGSHEVFLPIISTPEPEPEPLFKVMVKESVLSYTNIRERPTVFSAKRGVKRPLEISEVYEETGDWYRIKEGYVQKEFFERYEEYPTTLILEVEPLSQNDPRWANHKLGYSNYTIAQMGCAIVCITMTLRAMGIDIYPDQLNDALVRIGGFDGAKVYWLAVEDVQPNVYRDRYIECYYGTRPLYVIDELLSQGCPVMVHVDYDIDTPKLEQHWILVIGKIGNDYFAIDPITGKRILFSSLYGDPKTGIYRITNYRKLK